MASFAKVFYWCSVSITILCEIAATTIFAALATNKLESQSENWTAMWFFAVAGGVSWMAGYAAKSSSD